MTEFFSGIDSEATHERAPVSAPLFCCQVAEMDRMTEVTYRMMTEGAVTSNDRGLVTMTEHDALVGLDDFLQAVQLSNSAYANQAGVLRDTLTFIGKKEYEVAVKGIARRWMDLLDADQMLLLHVAADGLASDPCYAGMTKSNDYLLASVLSVFSECEWVKYGERIFLEGPYNTVGDGFTVRTILLDDWTISGAQLSDAYSSLIARHPEADGAIEVQLIVASSDRLQHGFEVFDSSTSGTKHLPVYAHYRAHQSDASQTGAHITGLHSSVDFDFEDILKAMANDLSRLTGAPVPMPPLTNIVRPYRLGAREASLQ